MARDMAKKAISDRRADLKTYDRIAVKFRKDSGIRAAFDLATSETGVSMAQYVTAALREKLLADGYLQDEPSPHDNSI